MPKLPEFENSHRINDTLKWYMQASCIALGKKPLSEDALAEIDVLDPKIAQKKLIGFMEVAKLAGTDTIIMSTADFLLSGHSFASPEEITRIFTTPKE